MKRFGLLLSAVAWIALAVGAASQSMPATTHPSSNAVIEYLNRTVDWYRRVQALDQSSGESQEVILRAGVVQNARQVVQLALKFARAEQAILEAEESAGGGAAGAKGRQIAQEADVATERASRVEARLAELDRQISNSSGDALDQLYAQRYELTAELNLANTQRDVLAEYAMFMTSADSGDAATLKQKIDELERSVPEVTSASDKSAASASSTSAPPVFDPDTAGIFGLISELVRVSSKTGAIKELADDATKIRDQGDAFHQPMRDETVKTYQISEAAASATQPTTRDSRAMEQHGIEIDRITDRFKALSSAGIPLAEQRLVLDASRDGLMNLHAAVNRQSGAVVRVLLLRLGTLAAVIFLIFVISELWRRATFRYIRDPRRQRQIMVVRRITIGLIALIVILASVVHEFGSLATFAGLITAGIAVSLQTVILSGVAYFFFIGRFGVRVGDRVTISGITGDVIEIGLFRIYLMELSGKQPDLQRTGRVVVFANSVLFQPSAFYKQLPGSDYIWHEIGLTLSPDSDLKLAENRLLGAVNSVFADYRDAVQEQHAQIARSLHVPISNPVPEGRLRFVDAGLEFVVRYPVDIRHASQIDDRITRELIKTLNEEPKLQVVSGTPNIRPA